MPDQATQMLPTARGDVVLRRVGNEWVLFDAAHDRAHVLNLTAAVVWTYCDGEHDPGAISAAINREIAGTPSEQVLSDVEGVLRRFGGEGLLQ